MRMPIRKAVLSLVVITIAAYFMVQSGIAAANVSQTEIAIFSEPSNATVTIGGVVKGTTSITKPLIVSLPHGITDITYSATGFVDQTLRYLVWGDRAAIRAYWQRPTDSAVLHLVREPFHPTWSSGVLVFHEQASAEALPLTFNLSSRELKFSNSANTITDSQMKRVLRAKSNISTSASGNKLAWISMDTETVMVRDMQQQKTHDTFVVVTNESPLLLWSDDEQTLSIPPTVSTAAHAFYFFTGKLGGKTVYAVNYLTPDQKPLTVDRVLDFPLGQELLLVRGRVADAGNAIWLVNIVSNRAERISDSGALDAAFTHSSDAIIISYPLKIERYDRAARQVTSMPYPFYMRPNTEAFAADVAPDGKSVLIGGDTESPTYWLVDLTRQRIAN